MTRGEAKSRPREQRRRALPVVIVVIVLVAAAGSTMLGLRATDRGAPTMQIDQAPAAWVAGGSELQPLGIAGSGGVIVRSSAVQCGLPQHDWAGGRTLAAGQFCVVDVELENRTTGELDAAPASFALTAAGLPGNPSDPQISAFTDDALGASPGRTLPSGETGRIHLVFDVPADATGPFGLRFLGAPGAPLTL